VKRLKRDDFTRVLDPKMEPKLVVDSGEEFIVETWDAFMGAWGVGETPEHVGPAAGPIAVRGATPDDTLKVELLKIIPKEMIPGRAALHNTSASHGFLRDTFNEHHPLVMAIDNGDLLFPNGIRIPTKPSLGFIATTYSEPRQTNTDSGPYGGDIDMKELTAGSTIWLPIFVPGALLCLGDVHAVLGDGCVGGTGAECAGEVQVRVSIEKGRKILRPRALTEDHFVTLCYGEDIGEAMKQSVRDMVSFLVDERGMEPYLAYSLLSLAGDVRMNRTFRPVSPVKMMLPRSVLDQVKPAARARSN